MDFIISLDFWLLLQLLVIPVLLPMLVGLVTTYVTAPRTQGILLLALSVITAFLTEMLSAFQSGAEQFDIGLALVTSLATFVFGVGVHLGFLKTKNASGVSITDSLLTHGRVAKYDDTRIEPGTVRRNDGGQITSFGTGPI